MRANAGLVAFPVLLCLLLFAIQKAVDLAFDPAQSRCVCQACVEGKHGDAQQCRGECAVKFFQLMTTGLTPCPEPKPAKWPALLQLPVPELRAATDGSSPPSGPTSTDGRPTDLPEGSRGASDGVISPVAFLVTGHNRSLAESLGKNLLGSRPFLGRRDTRDPLAVSANHVLGTFADPPTTYFFEPAFVMLGPPILAVQERCSPGFSLPISTVVEGYELAQDVICVQGLHLWRNSSSAISREIHTGYVNGNTGAKINKIVGAYDFLNTSDHNFDVVMWYNGTTKLSGPRPPRILRAINMASNSFLQSSGRADLKVLLEFVKEMPKGVTTPPSLNLSTLLGPLFFTWVIELLFPAILTCLVYEKQKNLRIIMKMHGLGDGPYWAISYLYFLSTSSAYVLCLVVFSSIIGLKIFTLNDYSIQFVFYFVYINLQVALAFLLSTLFSDVKTATGYDR